MVKQKRNDDKNKDIIMTECFWMKYQRLMNQ